ncbi:MAG: putative ABC exporter domain-containing protein [Eubacteriales bacterium]|nr:putative ABC exporter domain-containing protein [Eubacteriales bacterium]
MSATAYVLKRSILNGMRQAFKKPAALVGYIFILALVAFTIFSGRGIEAGEPKNLEVFAALVLGIYALIFLLSAAQGLKQGSALFRMADVNLLFTSPVRPQSILVYGIARQAGILVLASVGMLMQYTNLRLNFGLGGGAVGGLMAGYVLVGVASQLLSASLYAFCAAKPKARGVIANVMRALGIALGVGFAAFVAIRNGSVGEALKGFFGARWWSYVPVLGWAQGVAVSSAHGELTATLVFSGLSLLACGGLGLWLYKSSSDYYEDVLLSAETLHTVREAAKEGRVVSAGAVGKRARKSFGPLRGKGASAFFYRAWREQQKKGIWLFTLTTIGALAGPCFVLILRASSGGELDGAGLWPGLYFSAYMLVFLSIKDGITSELTRLPLFLAPVSAWKKLVAVSVPQMIRFATDACVFAAVGLVVLKSSVSEAFFAAIAYASMGAVFAACIVLTERLLSGSKSSVLVMLIYLGILVVVLLPGFIAGGVLSGASFAAGYLACAAWNLFASALLLFLCRNLLHSMEL